MSKLEMFKHNWKPNCGAGSYEDFCLRTDLKELAEEIRAEVIETIKDSIHEIYHCQFYCMADMCEHDSPTVDMCIDCFYETIEKKLEELKEQK